MRELFFVNIRRGSIIIARRKAKQHQIEKFKEQNLLTKEKVVDYLTNSVLKKPKQMIQTLVRKIVVYEDKIEIYYNYTDETNPGDDTPRDSCLLSGSDSSVIPGSNTTNPNQNEKNYPKGSDSSVMVELKAAKTHTVLSQINRTEYYCQVDLPLSDYPLYGKQLVASRG